MPQVNKQNFAVDPLKLGLIYGKTFVDSPNMGGSAVKLCTIKCSVTS